MDFGGSKSSTRTNTMVNINTETDNGNLEVLQQSQMQEEAMASQSSCQTKSSLAVNKNETPSKGPYTRSRVDATKVASPGANASNTGQHLRPCKKSKGLGKRVKLEDNQGATELSRPPINLFEDECVFCHSFRTIEEVHGPMVRYLEGRIVSSDEGNLTSAIYVHKKCMDWAPRVFFDGKRFVNMEKEISRASRLKCSKCRLPGAALGCYHHPCANTYHVPCALMIRECVWDDENRNVWCPKHASNQLPCDEMSSPIMESDINSPIVQNQYLVKQGMSIIHTCEDQQVNQQNTSSSSLSQGQCSDKEGICADYRREENQTNQTVTPVTVGRAHQGVMSFGEKLPPPPGFGAAAASRRPPCMDFGGSKSATRTNMMVNIKTETDNGNLEVLQQSQMQESMASQSSCQTKSSLPGNKNETPSKGPYTRSCVDATKVASPGVDASNTGQHLRPCKKSKGLGKRGKLEDNQGATEFSRPPTQINLFEDECVFCHSFRTIEEFHGPMVRYREGRIVCSDEGNLTNAIYVHKKCMNWAPRVFFDGKRFVNMEKEISRASRLKCSKCRLPGAALGCYHHPCANTYHVPCALMIRKCVWDVENRNVWCPKHASNQLPCDEMSSPIMESDISSPIVQNQYLVKQGMPIIHRCEDQQVNQQNTSSSCLPQSQCSDREGIYADYQREENHTNQSVTHVAVGRVHRGAMLFGEKLTMPPGFGAAAAGRRPPRMDFGGSKSSTRTNTMVNIKTEADNANLEVLQQSQMQEEAMATQSSCQTKSSLAGNKNGTPSKGPYTRSRVDATKVASPGVNASNTGHHLRPCKKRKGLGKSVKLEDKQGATELSRPPRPINFFDDECVFCHSFRTSEKFHGPMVRYRGGRIVSSAEGNPANAIYVHKNCMLWAPKVYLNGDTYINVEKEIGRASRLKCSKCKLPGAALGCNHDSCPQTYHVPCAMMILDRWDVKNLHVLCPKHASDRFPCEEMSSPMMGSATSFPILQKQYLDKQGMSVIHRRKDQQVDQPNTLSSSLPQGQCLDKEGNSSDFRREENQTNHSITPVEKWVLLGSVLSASEKDSLKEFASLTSSILVEEWDKNVTHIIVGRSAGSTCGRSYGVLMAILSGKWVVTAGWIIDCLAELIPGPKTCLAEPITVPEISYEVKFLDGPKKGREGAAEVAPKLFSGLYFCLSAYLNPECRENIQTLIAAAEGQVLEGSILSSLQENLGKNPANVYFIYYEGPPRDYAETLFVGKEFEEAMKYASLGAQAISHLRVFHAIASYDALMLERSYRFTPDTYAETAC